MTDRELLELAAKAAGIDWIKNCVWIENGFYSPLAKHERISWNPLTEDRDALRLAVRCDIDIVHAFGTRTALAPETAGYVADGAEAYAATRRAIVKAAAEIGKAMP
jgi:hypothetical protein